MTQTLQQDSLEGLYGLVAGWGITEDQIPSPVLMSVGLPILTNEECQAAYGRCGFDNYLSNYLNIIDQTHTLKETIKSTIRAF